MHLLVSIILVKIQLLQIISIALKEKFAFKANLTFFPYKPENQLMNNILQQLIANIFYPLETIL